jgi:hypothetical protein
MTQHHAKDGFPWKKLIFGAGIIAAIVWILRKLLGEKEK